MIVDAFIKIEVLWLRIQSALGSQPLPELGGSVAWGTLQSALGAVASAWNLGQTWMVGGWISDDLCLSHKWRDDHV